jgi:predicted phage terminase large subunit-like protein
VKSKKSQPSIVCRSCGEEHDIGMFRLFETTPKPLYMDFCNACERKHGTITLYRRYVADSTPKICQAVYAAERILEGRRSQDQVRLLIQQVDAVDPETNAEVVLQELQRRELARRKLIYFVTVFFPEYKAGWVHQDICRRLERFMHQVERGESPRLMLFCPPRMGKSTLMSDFFVSWVLGHHPEWELITAGYAQALPIKFSRNVRDRLNDKLYQAMFPNTEMRKDSQAVDDWRTTGGGGLMAAGIGVGISGRGAHIGIIDDPVKDQEAAQSETIRDGTHAWYQSTFRTRLAPGGGILLVQTRWHDADLAGKLLEDEDKLRIAGVPEVERENWEVVSYPAIAEQDEYLLKDGSIFKGVPELDDVKRLLRRVGEAIHPERYTLDDLKKLRNTSATPIWNALYQQNPTPDDGEFFKRDDFVYRQLSKDYWPSGTIITTADYAFKKTNRNDFTVIATGLLYHTGELYVLDIRRGRWSALEVANQIVDVFKTFKPQVFAGEQGATHAAVWPIVQQQMEKQRLYVSVDETLVPIQDKELRARPLQAWTQMRKLIFSFDPSVRPAIFDITEREMLRFPTGAHDDIVDALAWLVRLSMVTSLPTQPQPKKRESWKDRLKVHVEGPVSYMGM